MLILQPKHCDQMVVGCTKEQKGSCEVQQAPSHSVIQHIAWVAGVGMISFEMQQHINLAYQCVLKSHVAEKSCAAAATGRGNIPW